MKVKITPYSFLLWITTIIVAVTFLLFCAFLEKGLEITKIQDGYLSERHRVNTIERFLTDYERDVLWEGIEGIPNHSFAIFMDTRGMYDDTESVKNEAVLGAYFQNNMSTPPILSGRFLSKEEMRSTAQVAVIGGKFLNDTYNKDGKDFLSLRGQEFEVIGIMGIDSPSTLDSMIYIPFRTSMELYKDWRCNIMVDAKTRNVIYKVLTAINPVVKTPEYLLENMKSPSTNEAAKSILKGNESMDNITEMYLITTLNVIIVILFSAFYWGQRKKKFIEVGYMLGFSNTSIFRTLLFEYLKITIPALLLVFAVFTVLSPMLFTYKLNILRINNIFGVLSIIVIPGLLVILFEMFCRSNKKIRKRGTK